MQMQMGRRRRRRRQWRWFPTTTTTTAAAVSVVGFLLFIAVLLPSALVDGDGFNFGGAIRDGTPANFVFVGLTQVGDVLVLSSPPPTTKS